MMIQSVRSFHDLCTICKWVKKINLNNIREHTLRYVTIEVGNRVILANFLRFPMRKKYSEIIFKISLKRSSF